VPAPGPGPVLNGYEALRAVIIEGCRQKEVADRFGHGYAAFRQQVTRFRARCAAGQLPPFSLLSRQTTRYPLLGPEGRRSSPLSPTVAP
jgi:hypothetical protein